QGRSNLLQGTRRVVERNEAPDTSPSPSVRTPPRKLVTRVEVVITNRGTAPATAFVREGVEAWGNGAWTVTQNSHPFQKLGDHMIEFKVSVPEHGNVKVEYTVEVR
ncbi:MAG TPA: hypothetical protein VL359_01425, partial [bacterium]|nr:hypothetical protein [bacterium]